MSQEPIDYEAVLLDLEAKRAAIEAAIAAVRLAVSTGAQVAMGSSATGATRPIDPTSIPGDAFFGLSIGEAAKKYLTIVKRKQSVREIADALDRGGLPHSSSNFVATVGTMLNRAARGDQDLVRIGRGEWGLAGWYGNRRPKQEPVKRGKKRGGRRGRKAGVGPKLLGPAREGSVSTPVAGSPSVRELAVQVLRAAGEPLHVGEIVKRIQEQTGHTVKQDTLASLFSVTVRSNDTFFKARPGVFGLIGQA